MISRSAVEAFLAHKELAVVGVSRSGEGFGNIALGELGQKGLTLHVVHPEAKELRGYKTVPSLKDLAGKVKAALLITQPSDTEKLVAEAAEAGLQYLWLQQGAESDEALRLCKEKGIHVVHGACILMFAEPVSGFPHRLHRGVKRLFGSLPA